MYEFARGPLVWIAFLILILGSLYRLIWMVVFSKKDKVVHPYMSLKYGLRSLFHWSIPFGARNMRLRPFFTVVSFLFHICLLVTPIFVLGHTLLWKESWNISLWSLPEGLADAMTIVVVIGVVFFALRRISMPAVRYVTYLNDYLLLGIVIAPFATGLMARYQVFNYQTMIVVHMFTGAIWLAAIPFTRIVHMLFYPFTRAYMGSESGYVRSAKDW
ncbi:MAG: nitrate reductase [Gemmatimonas sp. SG8_17]|nr:MAG: nitrate reductase [Gemmatimonas sp. SG8_17]